MKLDDFGWKQFCICIGLIIISIFATIGIINMGKKQGYILGTGIDVTWVYSMEHFKYDNTSVVLSPTANHNVFEYSNDNLFRVDDFDARRYDYVFYVNEHIGSYTEILARQINTQFIVDFFNTDGSLAMTSTLHVSVEFLTGRTKLTLRCNDGIAAVNYWNTFFKDYGFRLKAETTKGVA